MLGLLVLIAADVLPSLVSQCQIDCIGNSQQKTELHQYAKYPSVFLSFYVATRDHFYAWGHSEWTAAATILIGIFTVVLSIVAASQKNYFRRAERAYVKMSHRPPGLSFGEGYTLEINILVKNFGRTPARITDIVMNRWLATDPGPLPITPKYERRADAIGVSAFLVANDEFFHRAFFQTPEADEIKDGAKRCIMFGYVDYIDAFRQRHRAGYARIYLPSFDDRSCWPSNEAFEKRTNLLFFEQVGYNYDRLRRRGEGIDWDQDE